MPMRSPPLAACRRRWSATISRPRHQAFALRAGINRTYQDLAIHYGFAVLPTRIKKSRDKAKAEVAAYATVRKVYGLP